MRCAGLALRLLTGSLNWENASAFPSRSNPVGNVTQQHLQGAGFTVVEFCPRPHRTEHQDQSPDLRGALL